jgi:hypothetical protein
MRSKFLAHLRRQWMGALALFLVLSGGTAWAANTVFSTDIVNGEVKNPDLATNAVTSAKIKNGEAKLGDLAPDSVNGAKAVNNSLTADVAESSLGEVPAATLGGLGRDAGGPNNNCDPESGQGFVTCAITQSVNVSAPTRVLVVGQIAAQPELIGTDGNGSCRIFSSAGALTESTAHTFLNEQFDNLVMSAVTNALEPGPIQFGIECSEAALIEYRDAHVSWVALSPS